MSHHIKHSKKSRTETRLPPEEDPEFQIAPMIDILLVLLVFFMSISSTEVLQTNQDINLPVAKDGKQARKVEGGQSIINVTWAAINNVGGIEMDGVKYATPADITPKIQQKITTNPLMRVLIRADRQVRYDFLRAILVACGQAGANNVTFSVVDKDAGAAPAEP